MDKRKPIPPLKCDYMIRMHLKSIEELSRYMRAGCKDSGLNGPSNVVVSSIEIRDNLNEFIEEFKK